MTIIDRMVVLNLILNGVDPRTATELDRQHARHRCEACAKIMNQPLDEIAASMCEHFSDKLADFGY